MAYWKLDNELIFESHKSLDSQSCYVYVVNKLRDVGDVVYGGAECEGMKRISNITAKIGQVIFTEEREYLHSSADINKFYLLKSIKYKAKYDG